MEKLYTVTKKRPEADCGSDHELLIAQFRLKLKKVEKTTRPFKYKKKVKQVKISRVLPRECTGHSKHPLPKPQEKTPQVDITRWSTPKSD